MEKKLNKKIDRVGIFFGGKSSEHEISLLSAEAVINAIDKEKHQVVLIGITREGQWKFFDGNSGDVADGSWEEKGKPISVNEACEMIDFAFPVLHGPFGEDGRIQGLFETMNIPYAGSGVMSSALCMDKAFAKEIFLQNGIPTVDSLLVTKRLIDEDMELVVRRCQDRFSYPVFVKPANLGSSLGISKAGDKFQLKAALRLAAQYDRRVLVEQGINAREIECAIIGNDQPVTSGVGEISAAHDFYDYEAKYTDESGTEIHIPADIEESLVERIRAYAERAYRALDCAGFARADFLIDKDSNEIFLSEFNTIPGCTKYSMFPMLWKQQGIDFTEIIERIVRFGYERHHVENNW
ncbi:MAG: D-alanine--D-alanine ligase family protein [Hornefia sp.]|nr:D-alanine--D-alanine ligase family protein [Hornefia sp.]